MQGRSVGILLPDGTRDLPIGIILSKMLPLLGHAKKIIFFICTGTHKADTVANRDIADRIRVQAAFLNMPDFEIVMHDCQMAAFRTAGITPQGTDVRYNSRLDELDVFVVLSDIKHHYFAGYSNPIKNIMPGLCAFETVEQNHRLTFDDRSRAAVHPWHSDADKRDNPLAADQLEAMKMIIKKRPVWAMTTVSSEGNILWAALDDVQRAAARAFTQVDKWNIHQVDPVDFMVVSPGGLPNDVDLYIAQRALELTTSVLRDGGQLLFLASCPGGIGSPLTHEHFEKRLTMSLEEILRQVPQTYHLFEHKPYRFAKLIKRLDKLWFYTQIDPAMIENIHMRPCVDPQDVVSGWLKEKKDVKILLVDGANKLLLGPQQKNRG
jgi:nickel-dependent lactate racemase